MPQAAPARARRARRGVALRLGVSDRYRARRARRGVALRLGVSDRYRIMIMMPQAARRARAA
jgi:hypothetical protein